MMLTHGGIFFIFIFCRGPLYLSYISCVNGEKILVRIFHLKFFEWIQCDVTGMSKRFMSCKYEAQGRYVDF